MRLLFASIFLLVGVSYAQSRPGADMVITNAKVWTVDGSHPTAQAVAVLGDRIVAVGSSEEIEAWVGARTRVIDAGGKLLLPGFNDAHVHFVSGGQQLDNVQLKDASTRRSLRAASVNARERLQMESGLSAVIGTRRSGILPTFLRSN